MSVLDPSKFTNIIYGTRNTSSKKGSGVGWEFIGYNPASPVQLSWEKLNSESISNSINALLNSPTDSTVRNVAGRETLTDILKNIAKDSSVTTNTTGLDDVSDNKEFDILGNSSNSFVSKIDSILVKKRGGASYDDILTNLVNRSKSILFNFKPGDVKNSYGFKKDHKKKGPRGGNYVIRDYIEPVGATEQCDRTGIEYVPYNKAEKKGQTMCWLCGCPIRKNETGTGGASQACEHIIPALRAVMFKALATTNTISKHVKSHAYDPKIDQYLHNNYLWSHADCNSIKGGQVLMKLNDATGLFEPDQTKILNLALSILINKGTKGKSDGTNWYDYRDCYGYLPQNFSNHQKIMYTDNWPPKAGSIGTNIQDVIFYEISLQCQGLNRDLTAIMDSFKSHSTSLSNVKLQQKAFILFTFMALAKITYYLTDVGKLARMSSEEISAQMLSEYIKLNDEYLNLNNVVMASRRYDQYMLQISAQATSVEEKKQYIRAIVKQYINNCYLYAYSKPDMSAVLEDTILEAPFEGEIYNILHDIFNDAGSVANKLLNDLAIPSLVPLIISIVLIVLKNILLHKFTNSSWMGNSIQKMGELQTWISNPSPIEKNGGIEYKDGVPYPILPAPPMHLCLMRPGFINKCKAGSITATILEIEQYISGYTIKRGKYLSFKDPKELLQQEKWSCEHGNHKSTILEKLKEVFFITDESIARVITNIQNGSIPSESSGGYYTALGQLEFDEEGFNNMICFNISIFLNNCIESPSFDNPEAMAAVIAKYNSKRSAELSQSRERSADTVTPADISNIKSLITEYTEVTEKLRTEKNKEKKIKFLTAFIDKSPEIKTLIKNEVKKDIGIAQYFWRDAIPNFSAFNIGDASRLPAAYIGFDPQELDFSRCYNTLFRLRYDHRKEIIIQTIITNDEPDGDAISVRYSNPLSYDKGIAADGAASSSSSTNLPVSNWQAQIAERRRKAQILAKAKKISFDEAYQELLAGTTSHGGRRRRRNNNKKTRRKNKKKVTKKYRIKRINKTHNKKKHRRKTR